MQKSNITEKYLEQLMLFKSKKEIHNEYLGEEDLDNFLKELTLELGFDGLMWFERKLEAKRQFEISQEIKNDSDLYLVSGKIQAKLRLTPLIKSLQLDPFNQEYLKEYLFNRYNEGDPERIYILQYLRLFPPSSTELINLQVDFGIGPDELNYDYFNDDTIGPYVDGLVFLKEQVNLIKENPQSDQLKAMAKDAGIDKQTLEEVEAEVQEMLSTVENATGGWAAYDVIHKAYLTVDKMVNLAPYNREVLSSACRFYGFSLWRAFIGSSSSKISKEKKVFFKIFFGTAKPSLKQKIEAAENSIEKGKALELRLRSLPVKDSDDTDNSEMDLTLVRLLSGSYDEADPNKLRAFIDAQLILIEIYKQNMIFRKSNLLFLIIMCILMYAIGCVFSAVVIGSIHFIWTFIMVPGMIAFGIAFLRKTWWQKYGLDLKE